MQIEHLIFTVIMIIGWLVFLAGQDRHNKKLELSSASFLTIETAIILVLFLR